MRAANPIIPADFPDPDVIRVGRTYYMASTTMHFMPGAAILRSRDLANWELVSHAYETLDGTPGQRLEDGASAYGQGMWAPSLRHDGRTFHLCFVANDTRRTYLYRAEDPAGPWRKSLIEGFYHDCSLLFDDDGRTYLFHGNTEIRVTELDAGLGGPKAGGLDRVVVRDRPGRRLGYEGSHAYKIGGRYYLFLIHWLSDGSGRRTQACFSSDSLDGEFLGGDVLDDDLGFFDQGVAQGGIVDTPEGDWYAMLFQDRGAAGRMPILLPLRWEGATPVLGDRGRVPLSLEFPSLDPGYAHTPFARSDDFRYLPGPDGAIKLDPRWEWNHEPRADLWSVDAERGELKLVSGKLSENPTRAVNTLTQRAAFPACAAEVAIDGSGLRDGDFAGICALQGRWAMLAIAREGDRFFAVMKANPGEAVFEMGRTMDLYPGVEFARVPLAGPRAEFRAELDFGGLRDEASFSLRRDGEWTRLGPVHRLRFDLDHFCGCRFGLFLYSTRRPGGEARFSAFDYRLP